MLSNAEFLARDGDICPSCESENIKAISELEVSATILIDELMKCLDCGAWWVRMYHLHGYRAIKGPRKGGIA